MQLSRRLLLKTSIGGTIATALPIAAKAQWKTAPDNQAMPLLHLNSREKLSLDGAWKYIVDPFDAAKRGDNLRRTFWKNTKSSPTGPLVEYDWEKSPEMDLPRDWNSTQPELQWYDGPVYFRRTFKPVTEAGSRQFLCFEAINYHATIWLNAERIGEHEGGFTPFALDVTEKLKAGENAIVICADSRHHPEAVPTDYTDWQNYGGVTRSIWLASVPATYIADWFVRLEKQMIVADIVLSGPAAAGADVSINIAGRKLGGKTDSVGKLRVQMRNRLALWSPERPVLHDVRISAAGHSVSDRIGLRTIETQGRQLLFNGKPIFLRGISMHEEPIGTTGTRRMTEADARKLLAEVKALGCNFVRLAHYPHSEVTLRIADEIGLIVWSEIPVYWEQIRYESPHTLALAKSMQRDMILRDRNRCSIGLWSVANETPQEEARTRFLRTLIAEARALDPTRLITAALNKNVDVGGAKEGQSNFSVTDELANDLDVLAINQYEAWYSKRTPAQLTEVSFSTPFEKPIMFSEFGADALAGNRGPKQDLWTEDYQAWLYEETLKIVDRTEGCVGLSPWVLKDFRSPRRWHPQYQQFWNRKGLISETGVRKAAFEVLRRYYAAKTIG
jgi:beta-glucuronidase